MAEVCLVAGAELLDFNLDVEAEEDLDPKATYSSSSSFTAAAVFADESLSGSFLEFAEEEELEWLSNKYEFPSVETCFGILSDNPELMLSHHSPSSVLDNSFGNANGSTRKAPVGPRSKGRKRRPRENYADLWSSQAASVSNRDTSSVARMGRRCLHCQSDKTPQWRAGPLGPKTLCNACGVRYKSGRLLPEYRPANSPTFSSELHSNSHRRVVEMRRAMG